MACKIGIVFVHNYKVIMHTFAQIPDFILLNAKLSSIQFRIYALLEYFRFIGQDNIDSKIIGDCLNVNSDTIRHQLNLMKETIDPDLVAFHFISRGYGKSHLIKIHFNYLKTSLSIKNNIDIEQLEQADLQRFLELNKSKNFKKADRDLLFEISNSKSASEVIKGIVLLDNLKKPPKKIQAYFKSLFHEGKVKYDLTNLKIISKPPNTKITDRIFYSVTQKDYENLKWFVKEDRIRLRSFKNNSEVILYHAFGVGNKENNLKNLLEKFKINYEMYQ